MRRYILVFDVPGALDERVKLHKASRLSHVPHPNAQIGRLHKETIGHHRCRPLEPAMTEPGASSDARSERSPVRHETALCLDATCIRTVHTCISRMAISDAMLLRAL